MVLVCCWLLMHGIAQQGLLPFFRANLKVWLLDWFMVLVDEGSGVLVGCWLAHLAVCRAFRL